MKTNICPKCLIIYRLNKDNVKDYCDECEKEKRAFNFIFLNIVLPLLVTGVITLLLMWSKS